MNENITLQLYKSGEPEGRHYHTTLHNSPGDLFIMINYDSIKKILCLAVVCNLIIYYFRRTKVYSNFGVIEVNFISGV